jgi:hypothetical protein
MTPPHFPIIYVRGYAMTTAEQNDTAADPFCGFNLGSTVYRATPDKRQPAKKFVFESPVLRLTTDFGYSDVYHDGLDVIDPDWSGSIPTRSIVIYRYYDEASSLLGSGETPGIGHFARGLSALILRVRELVCSDPDNATRLKDFRCYLVAHSMGGLVCRAFLQNAEYDAEAARACVDKVFTYATPHNGIELAGINVPQWLGANDMNNFSRDRMASYLDIETVYKKTGRVDWLPQRVFPIERFFCMVGTNRSDYEAAKGLSRTFVGHGSDGLVKIANASVWGITARGNVTLPCPTAYTYRSHSGPFGIVNGEESYQNLTRFLFGDVRIDMWADIDEVRLPAALDGKAVDALYQFELLAAPRGKRWYLTRRTAEEDSVACRRHKDLTDPDNPTARSVYLSSVFLARYGRVDSNRASLAYAVSFAVRVPDYEIERRFWADGHYEGGYLFNDAVIIETVPPQPDGDWDIRYGWQSAGPVQASTQLNYRRLKDGNAQITIPFDSGAKPGIKGRLRFLLGAWNN